MSRHHAGTTAVVDLRYAQRWPETLIYQALSLFFNLGRLGRQAVLCGLGVSWRREAATA